MFTPYIRAAATALVILFTCNLSSAQSISSHPPAAAPKYQFRLSPISLSDQKHWLDSFIPRKKHVAVLDGFLLATHAQEVNLRTACSSSTSGSINGPAPGTGDRDIYVSGSTVCKDLHDMKSDVAIADDGTAPGLVTPRNQIISGKIVFISCTSGFSKGQAVKAAATLGWSAIFSRKHACLMQPGPIVGMAPSREKDGYYIGVDVITHVGGKPQFSKYLIENMQKYEATEVASK